jgi:DMSO/TMAO reductase YedYZ molybdopterin-dependent catalytic subunit
MNKKVLIGMALLALVLVLGVGACGSSAPKVEWDLKVSGAVSSSLTLSYSDLAKMPQTDLKDVLMEKSTGEDVVTNWSGVSLDAILQQAGASADYVSATATAADGYAIEVSKDELQDAIVALKDDDGWIAQTDPDHGPIRLVCPHTPGNRWVFQLQEIQLNQ